VCAPRVCVGSVKLYSKLGQTKWGALVATKCRIGVDRQDDVMTVQLLN
jgi:hypothetical protein